MAAITPFFNLQHNIKSKYVRQFRSIFRTFIPKLAASKFHYIVIQMSIGVRASLDFGGGGGGGDLIARKKLHNARKHVL